MDEVEFLYPRSRKLLFYVALIIVFLIRWSDNVNTLEYQCVTSESGAETNCRYTGELRRHVGFPLETYKILVRGETRYNYFYDFNFAANLGLWYLVACILDHVFSLATAKKAKKTRAHKFPHREE